MGELLVHFGSLPLAYVAWRNHHERKKRRAVLHVCLPIGGGESR